MRWLAIVLCSALFGQAPALDDDILAAARKGDLPSVKALLAKGAALEAKSRYGQTPLFFAARNGHEEVVKFLLAKGASPNVNDTFYKMSLLAAAADKGYTGVVKALIDAGSPGAGEALEVAAERGSTEMLTMLIASGKLTPADLTAGLTAAEQSKKADVVELLNKAGAKPAPKPTAQISAEILKLYAGTYKGGRIGDVTVVLKENKLVLGSQGQSLDMGAFNETTFGLLTDPMARLTFTVEGGRATVLTYQRGAQTFSLKRVEGQ